MPRHERAPDSPTPTLLLLRGARDGDPRALDELYRRYLPRLNRWARGRLPSYARAGLDTQDLVQDALVGTLRRLDHLDPQRPGCFQAYTRQAILNAIRNHIRGARPRARASVVLDREPDRAPSPLEQLIGRNAVERYERALARLEPEEQELVVARIEFHCPFAEIAEQLGKPSADAARMGFRRALLKLAEEMGDV